MSRHVRSARHQAGPKRSPGGPKVRICQLVHGARACLVVMRITACAQGQCVRDNTGMRAIKFESGVHKDSHILLWSDVVVCSVL